jgi:uncharacterized protein YqgC (DUF456 family)
MDNKLKPAIIGGVVLGLLSVIPLVSLANLCCCLWAILGGVLASYLYIKASPTAARPSDGAILGLLAGVIGAAIFVVIGIPVGILMRSTMTALMSTLIENLDPSQARMIRRQMAAQTIAGAIGGGIVWAILLMVFSTIGGLLGIPIFEKRKDVAPPQAA